MHAIRRTRLDKALALVNRKGTCRGGDSTCALDPRQSATKWRHDDLWLRGRAASVRQFRGQFLQFSGIAAGNRPFQAGLVGEVVCGEVADAAVRTVEDDVEVWRCEGRGQRCEQREMHHSDWAWSRRRRCWTVGQGVMSNTVEAREKL